MLKLIKHIRDLSTKSYQLAKLNKTAIVKTQNCKPTWNN